MSHPFRDFAKEIWEDRSGGYGGIFKSILRIVVPIAVSFIPGAGPIAIALSSAAITAATGGSFTESLLAGATSFIGSSLSSAISGGLTPQVGFNPAAAFDDFAIAAGGSGAPAFSFGAGAAASGITGEVSNLVRTGANLLSDVVSPGFLATLANNADLIGRIGGGLATLTLNQAFGQDIPGLDEELATRFGPGGVELLRQQARDQQLEEIFQGLAGASPSLANPFLSEGLGDEEQVEGIREFQRVIAQGLRRQDQALGLDVTQSQFSNVFDNPNLGQNILGEERGIRQEGFTGELGEVFTGDAFGRIDDDIINSIIEERQGPAQQRVSNFEARGNLNPLGGKTANEFILGQVPTAGERLREVGGGVQQTNQAAVNDIRDRATQGIGAFQLGDDLFDVSPFGLERSNLISERGESLRGDILSSLGSEPLFDVTGALQTAGRTQGVVSGTPNVSFLDAIAAREAGATSKTRRGLGSRGSGAF